MENRIIFILAAIFASSLATGLDKKTMSETMPAYTILDNLDILNTSQCKREMEIFRDAVDNEILWSLRMLDASGQPGSGYTEGNNFWLGKYQQCNFLSTKNSMALSPTVRRNNSIYRDPALEYPPFELNFFTARMIQNSTLQYHIEIRDEDLVILGLCMPASCSSEELGTVLEEIFRNRTLLITHLYSADFKLVEISDLKDDHQWLLSGKIITCLFILSLSLGMVIVGTVYDLCVYQKRLRKKKEVINFENNNTTELKIDTETKHETGREETEFSNLTPESKLGQALMCFSAYSNVKSLFKTDSASDSILAFHGLKLLGMMWIVICHTIYYGRAYTGNRSIMYTLTNTLTTQIISNATFSVDTFFCISGFLLAYTYLKAQEKEKKVLPWSKHISQFYMLLIRRYVRITPAYLIVILASIVNFSWYDKVSMQLNTEHISTVCSQYWWRNLLYINNFFNWDDMCLSWSWYLANDMQFFVFGLMLLILSTKHMYIALSVGVLSLLSSITSIGYIAYNANFYYTLNDQYKYVNILYIRPWTRLPPYLLGMFTAYLLTKWNNKLHLSKRAKVMGWTFGIVCNCSILVGPCFKEISFTGSLFYITLGRTVWGLGITWLIVACLTNNGGIVNKFLSLPMWIPLSRVTYSAYHVNPFLISSICMYTTYPIYTDFLITGTLGLGMFFLTYVLSIVLSLIAETPPVLLLRLFFNSNRRMK